jgi:hypothetical protein
MDDQRDTTSAPTRQQRPAQHSAEEWIALVPWILRGDIARAATEQGITIEHRIEQLTQLIRAAVGSRRVTLAELSAALRDADPPDPTGTAPSAGP